MTKDRQHAADIAHGAITGRLADPEFDPAAFIKAELNRMPQSTRAQFMANVALAAIDQAAGTLIALDRLQLLDPKTGTVRADGLIDPADVMARAAQLRAEMEEKGQRDE